MDKRNKKNNLYIINADRLENNHLIDVSINIISNENIIKKELSQKADISKNTWNIKIQRIFNFDVKKVIFLLKRENMEFTSFYNVKKLNNLLKI